MDHTLMRRLIEQQLDENKIFIKWYTTADAGAQIEMVDYFLNSVLEKTSVAKFELLDLEQMWQELLAVAQDRVERVWRNDVEIIDWYVRGADGSEKLRSCSFRAPGLLATYEDIVAAR
ncbi:MAG: hypothetical protein RBR22_04280 [Desulfuromonas sp.]|nr:hypothetical protein [Desulfuromonas sp.]